MPEETVEEHDGTRTRPFADVLIDLNYGRVHTELSVDLQELIAAVIATEKSGALTLKLNISPADAKGMVVITDAIAVKMPELKRAASMFFVDDENNLTREDPRQREIPGLREVIAPDQELRDIK